MGAHHRRVIIAVAVLLSLALAGGIAYATIPDGQKVYSACMLRNIGTLRLIDPSLPSNSFMSHCTGLEQQVTWNQTGIQGLKGDPGLPGATGSQGIPGPPGPPGQAGASDHWYSAENNHVIETPDQEIVGLSGLAAGNYIVWVNVEIFGDIGDNEVCKLLQNGSEIQTGEGPLEVFPDTSSGSGLVHFMTTLSLANSSSVTVHCGGDNTDGTNVGEGNIVAVRVGALD